MIKLYGIPNCETVKKAQQFLEKKKIAFEFVNFKKAPPTEDEILRWKIAFGDWPVNKKGLTFKKYKTEYEKLDDKKMPRFLNEHSSMIKRPILEKNEKVLAFGFDLDQYNTLF
jgi:arsenate reductase